MSDEAIKLPYRAGYEVADRASIQQALQHGDLCGVVATSAMELGIDIGEIDLVVLLAPPPSVKAFWQRVGRAGRTRPGVCLVIDRPGSTSPFRDGLTSYLSQPLESNRLYVQNRYVQYAHALCAASEIAARPGYDRKALSGLPADFHAMLDNEVEPSVPVAPELYPLKQRAQSGPHYEFPLRNAIEPTFQVTCRDADRGTLSLGQMLREAYPGAIHYYMARPYRVTQVLIRDRKVRVSRCGYGTTQPETQNRVFPEFSHVSKLFRAGDDFVAETKMQVSERVLGFKEVHGKTRTYHEYRPGSPYAQRPLSRFFETSGVCWKFGDGVGDELAVAESLRVAFCVTCGIKSSDVGVGVFSAKRSPTRAEECKGVCIYDATYGSLRLTEQLADRFSEVVEAAVEMAEAADEPDEALLDALRALAEASETVRPVDQGSA